MLTSLFVIGIILSNIWITIFTPMSVSLLVLTLVLSFEDL